MFAQCIEKSAEYNLALCMAFSDYEKAFNLVKRFSSHGGVKAARSHELYIKIMEDIYRETARQPSNSTRKAGKFLSGKVLDKVTQSSLNYAHRAWRKYSRN